MCSASASSGVLHVCRCRACWPGRFTAGQARTVESAAVAAGIESGEATAPRWFSRGVAGIGTSSFLADLGHEIPTALLPSLLTATLHAPASALGLIEGISDAAAGVARLGGGHSRMTRAAGAGSRSAATPPQPCSPRRSAQRLSLWTARHSTSGRQPGRQRHRRSHVDRSIPVRRVPLPCQRHDHRRPAHPGQRTHPPVTTGHGEPGAPVRLRGLAKNRSGAYRHQRSRAGADSALAV